MKLYARLFEDGRVAELHSGDPKTDFCAAVADLFVEVPEGTGLNDKKTSKGFEKYQPPEVPAPPTPERHLSEAELKSFMTRSERIAYKAAADSDPIIADFAEMVALRPQKVKDADTVEAIDKMQELKVLSAARATELKSLEV
jgi:hypothetical protein|tara:strand:+ start:11028 stop:11453 length:426 start_codon:yes stop_codon:yes gene_type:complete